MVTAAAGIRRSLFSHRPNVVALDREGMAGGRAQNQVDPLFRQSIFLTLSARQTCLLIESFATDPTPGINPL
jgi:hypothetical protein